MNPLSTTLLLACSVLASSSAEADWRRPSPGILLAQVDTVGQSAGDGERDVQESDLAPIADDATSIDADAGAATSVSLSDLSRLLPELSLPPRSFALARSASKILGSRGGGDLPATYSALFKSGALASLLKLDDGLGDRSRTPAMVLAVAEAGLALGRDDAACSAVKRLVGGKTPLDRADKIQALLNTALCAALDGKPETASLAAAMLRDGGIKAPVALAALDALAGKDAKQAAGSEALSVADVRLAALAGRSIDPALFATATPAALVAAADSRDLADDSRLVAAEAAASLSLIEPAVLGKVYGRAELDPSLLADPSSSGLEGAPLRALLFRALRAGKDDRQRISLARQLFASAGPALVVPLAVLLRPQLEGLEPTPQLAEFTETSITINLLAGDYAAANRWAVAGSQAASSADGDYVHWMMLINIADPDAVAQRQAALRLTEDLALAGKLQPALLHRLISVLDALEYDIPVPLWDAASRTPQPTEGYLPATGRLAELQVAAKSGNQARTVLLSMIALGPSGAADANLLSLGDTIRALMAAGLEPVARRIGLEALYPFWPRHDAS